MIDKSLLQLVNHEAWIECSSSGRAYLKWGHFPKIDGKLDPKSITKAFVIYPDRNKIPLIIGTDRVASSEGGLFLEFKAESDGIYTIAAEYDRGIYTITEDNKWIFGEKGYVKEMGYTAKESRWICGFAKTYFIAGEYEDNIAAGLELEIIPEVVKKFRDGEKMRFQVLFRGEPVRETVNVRTKNGLLTIETDNNGFAEIELLRGANVISARYVDETVRICDKRNLTTTLTIIAD